MHGHINQKKLEMPSFQTYHWIGSRENLEEHAAFYYQNIGGPHVRIQPKLMIGFWSARFPDNLISASLERGKTP